MANTARTSRDQDTRQTTARVVYTPPSSLPEPIEHPDYVFRWVATHVLGQADPSNVSKRNREGWEPCRAEDHPEMKHLATTSGNIELGGLMLCKIAREIANARAEYYSDQAKRQMESVDNTFMQQNDSRMAKFAARKSTVTRGPGFGNGS